MGVFAATHEMCQIIVKCKCASDQKYGRLRARKTNFSRPLARRSCVWAQGIPLWSSQGLFSLCGGREPSSCGVRLPRQMFRWTHTLPGVVIFQSLSLIFEVLKWCFRDSRALLRQHLHQAGWAWTEPVGCWVFFCFYAPLLLQFP